MPKKSKLGQNFLVNQNTINSIIEFIEPQAKEFIIEIGPGKGALTKHLLAAKVNLQAIELDKKLIEILKSTFKSFQEHLTIINTDAAKDIHPPKSGTWRLVGNIPYQISSPLLSQLIKLDNHPDEIYLMLQEEFAQRLAAKVNTSNYGRLAIITQCCYYVELLLTVPANDFAPPPKVNSKFVRLTQNKLRNKIKDLDKFNIFIKDIFNQRRKILKSNKSFPNEFVEYLDKRPEELDIDTYINIYHHTFQS